VAVYPPSVNKIFLSARHVGKADAANAAGKAATFVCGSFVRFSIGIDGGQKRITSVKIQTNGCGFMIAAAEVIAEAIEGLFLSDLQGLNDEQLNQLITQHLGLFQPDRDHCQQVCFEAIRGAFFDYRVLQLEEFQGEKALICTCFGVAEETIEQLIDKNSALSVERVGELCNAGSGCGSCRMLIQELIDQHDYSAHRTGKP
jgi:NifU-like protein involved in Fe-S cluster formation/bacterioferritin-associated ferredoxin